MDTFVSVIVATYNRKSLLPDLLASLDKQTYPHFEVIAVDNASSDGTWEWLVDAENRYHYPLRILRSPVWEPGPAGPRNLAIAQARGSIVAITDSDCVAAPDWIERGVRHFRGDTGFVQGKTIPHPEDPRPMFFTTGSVDDATGDTSNIFYLRKALEQVGGFAADFMGRPTRYSMYGDDVDLAYRVREAGYEAVFAEDAVVMHHIVPLTLRQWLLRPLSAVTGPFLVRRHPRIRRELLFLHFFVNRITALFDLFLAGLVAGVFWSPFCLLLCVPFLVAKYREPDGPMNPAKRILRTCGGSVRSFVTFGALLCGSIRARSLLL